MNPLPTSRPRTVLLGLVNASLIVFVGFIWKIGQQRVHEPENLAIHSLADPDLAILNLPATPNVDVAEIRDQAVFHSRRSFYQPLPPSQILPTPAYNLSGTMELPQGKRIAFVRKQSDQTSRTLHVGDDLDGWLVRLIEPSRVVVARDDLQAELKGTGAAFSPGLIRGSAGAQIAQSGIRMLGSPAPVTSVVPKPGSTQARIYQPPPH